MLFMEHLNVQINISERQVSFFHDWYLAINKLISVITVVLSY